MKAQCLCTIDCRLQVTPTKQSRPRQNDKQTQSEPSHLLKSPCKPDSWQAGRRTDGPIASEAFTQDESRVNLIERENPPWSREAGGREEEKEKEKVKFDETSCVPLRPSCGCLALSCCLSMLTAYTRTCVCAVVDIDVQSRCPDLGQ
jgi:hypothetical protein